MFDTFIFSGTADARRKMDMYIETQGIRIHECRTRAVRNNMVIVGNQGRWWTDYATLVDDADRPLENHCGGYDNVQFGSKLNRGLKPQLGTNPAATTSKESQPQPPVALAESQRTSSGSMHCSEPLGTPAASSNESLPATPAQNQPPPPPPESASSHQQVDKACDPDAPPAASQHGVITDLDLAASTVIADSATATAATPEDTPTVENPSFVSEAPLTSKPGCSPTFLVATAEGAHAEDDPAADRPEQWETWDIEVMFCLLYTSPSPRDS